VFKRGLIAAWMTLVALALSAGTASGVVLVNQLPSGSFSSPAAVSHDYSNDAGDSQAADDFTVPVGQVWTVQGVDVVGATSDTGSHTAGVSLYATGGALPAGQLFAQTGIAIPDCTTGQSCDFSAPVSGAPQLLPGTYWLSVQTAGQSPWYWAVHPPDAIFGNPAVWQNPGNGFGAGCTSFTALAGCGIATATDGKDLAFALNGTAVDSRFTLGDVQSRGRRLSLTATFPGPGLAVIGGKGLKRREVAVAAAGAKTLPMKLKAAVRQRLAEGRKAKLKVKVDFTATGGVVFTQRVNVKLIPNRAAAGLRIVQP
jgi:hypothetical protein